MTVATWLVCSTGVSDSTALAQLFNEHYEFLLRGSPELATEVGRTDHDALGPAWFNLTVCRPETQVRFDKAAFVLHETNPGHHLQIALQLAL